MSQSYNSEADVLVVGAGMGGLTAAIQAAAEGARAVVIEKYPDVSRCSTAFSGGAFGVHTTPFGPHTPEELGGGCRCSLTLRRPGSWPTPRAGSVASRL